MAIFSFFKQRKSRGFHIETRFYDPVVEDLNNRVEAKKREMKTQENTDQEVGNYQARISSAFQRKTGKSKVNVGSLQFLFIFLFTLIALAYFYYGDIAIYGLLIITPVYIFIRRRI